MLAGPQAIWGTLQLLFPYAELRRKRLPDPDPGPCILFSSVENEIVGQLSLHMFPNSPRRKHWAQLGMAVRDDRGHLGDWKGKVVGTALMQAAVDLAEQWLNLLRLELGVYIENEPGIWLYKKLGFAVEGTKARFAFGDGQYVDVYMMARLRG